MLSHNQLTLDNWILEGMNHCYYLIHICPGPEKLRDTAWTIPKHTVEFTIYCSNCRETSPPMLTTYRILKDA